MSEKMYKIVPRSEITSATEDILFTAGLSSGTEFKALYKNSGGDCGIITVHILGVLKPEWEQKVIECFRERKELQIPLILNEAGFFASEAILQ